MNTPPRTAFAGGGPIVFQGIHLPHYAKYFYICTLRQLIPDEVYEWTLDLRYCWARQRQVSSSFVLNACDILEQHINPNREALFRHLISLRPDSNPDEVCQEMLEAVRLMRECAKQANTCVWTMQPQEGEIEKGVEQCMELLQHMEQPDGQRGLTEAQKVKLRAAPDSVKINFINSSTDSYHRAHAA
jgi:hypothetical protein